MNEPQARKAQTFHDLHVPGRPLVLHNIWDAGSAVAVAAAGAAALATGSWSVAAAHGYPDGEQLPLELVLANAARIVAAVPALPLSLDLESGYGANPAAVGATVARAIAAGVVGCNLEDTEVEGGALRPLHVQAARLAAARAAAQAAAIPLFLNARCDVFFQPDAARPERAPVEEALERAQAYAAAGADGLFLPGLSDLTQIAAIVRASPLPVNIMAGAHSPALAELAAVGVARVSHGPGPYRAAMALLTERARADRMD